MQAHLSIACPACKRRSFGGREVLGASLDGRAKCPACGRLARLDQMSRCVLSCVLALLLWLMLLHGDILYSGYLFLFSMIVILGGSRLLAAATLPLLSLEKAEGHAGFDRRQSIVTVAILIVLAGVIDGLLAYRSDADRAHDDAPSQGVSAGSEFRGAAASRAGRGDGAR